MLLIALTAVSFVAAPGDASERSGSADQAELHFQLGNEAYVAGNLRQALFHYFASNDLAPNKNVTFNIARCYEQLDQFVQAHRYYSRYAALDLAGDERTAVAKALLRIRPKVALLRIITSPAGATIYLGRRDLGAVGTSPMLLAVPEGEVRLIAELDGHQPALRDVAAAALGQTRSVQLDLKRILGTIDVTGSPAGASVKAYDPAGAVVTATVPTLLRVAPGEVQVEISAPGFVTHQEKVKVVAGGLANIEANLEPEQGTVVVQADEADALILIDDEPRGFTPAVIDGIRAGEHTVRVEMTGFRPYVRQIVVSPDARVVVDAQLSASDDVNAASRTTESLEQAPASVSVIGRLELESFGYDRVTTALRGVRGVYTSDDLTYETVGIRGPVPFGQYGNRLLVQIDGHTTNDDWIGSSYVGYDLLTTLEPLERIEVVRGASSVQYGTGAVSGVVNLVTPSGAPRAPATFGLSVAGPGRFRAMGTGGAAIGDDGFFWVHAAGFYSQPTDYLSPSRAAADEPALAENVDASEGGTVLLKSRVGDFEASGYFHQRRRGIPTASFDTIFGDQRTRTSDRRSFVELAWRPRVSDALQLHVRLYGDHYHYSGTFAYPVDEGGAADESYVGNWVGTELRTVVTPSRLLRLSVGVDYQFHFDNRTQGADGDGSYIDLETPYHVMSAYAIADLDIGEVLRLSAGLRFDAWALGNLPRADGVSDDRFIPALSPRLAAVLAPSDDDIVKLFLGRGFRTPSIYELVYNDGGNTQIPSPTLDNETNWSAELEYQRRLGTDLRLIVAPFVDHIDGLIVQRGEATNEAPLYLVNQTRAVISAGAEIELRRQLKRGVLGSLSYSYHRTRVGSLADGERFPNSPVHLAKAKIVLPLVGRKLRVASRITLDAGREDREGETVPAALLWDLALSGELESLGVRWDAGINNLLDWRHLQPVGEDVRDVRVVLPGLTFQFNAVFEI